jgi:lipoyl-dependent peroxiredoxin
MSTIYQTKATTTGGRNGLIKSEDGVLNIEVRIPKEMGGQGGSYSNPEQLFAAGYSACFDSALNMVARMQKIHLKDSKVSATVGLQSSEEEGFNIIVTLDVEIPGIEKAVALDLLNKAHAACPYSKAIRNNVNVTLNLL